ncbi:MAG: hypothetical protein AAB487_02575 [Patescibacteria group bacterium]
MFLKFRPLLYSAVFLYGLEVIIFKPALIILLMSFLLLAALYEGQKIGHKWKFSILPVFFTIFSIALLQLISGMLEKQIFVGLVSLMYYLALFGTYRLGIYAGDQTAKGMIMASTSAAIFFTYAGAYGLYLNFLVPLYVLMLTYLIVTLLVSYQYFSIIEQDKNRVWTYSFLLALFMVELIWTMNFWPFGYLTTGVIALILYYVLWDLTQSYFLNLLSKKRVVANMIFFSTLIILILLSSKWIPVI